MEIERKFTIKTVPENLEQYVKKELEQAYLSTGAQGVVIRVRRSNEAYILTYKSKKGIIQTEHATAKSCEEVELPLTKEAYEHLKEKADGQVITKTRYIIPLENGLKIELDVFHGYLEGLVFAEVEFSSEDEAAAFKVPDWFDEDVTFDRRYSNAVMTRYSSLDELLQSSSK